MPPESQVDKTTEKLLFAGAALIEEHGLRPALARFSLRDVAERAGVSPGSLYQRWPNTEDFLKALATYVMSSELAGSRPDRYLIPLLEQGLSGNEILREWSRQDLKVIVGSPRWNAKIALWPLLDDEDVAESVRDHYERVDAADISPARLMIAWHGGRLRENLRERDLVVLRTAIREGLAMRKGIDPDLVRDDIRTDELTEEDSDWNLLGLSLAALNASFFESATND